MVDDFKDPALADELVRHDLITREELDEIQKREEATGTPWFRQLLQTKRLHLGVLSDVLRWEFHPTSKVKEHESLGQSLVKLGVLTGERLEEALAEQKRNGRLLGKILLDRGWVTRDAISRALSTQYELEYAGIEDMPSDPRALDAVPESYARKYQVIPVALDGDRLTVLIANPQARSNARKLGVILGKRVYPMLTTVEDIAKVIGERYRDGRSAAGPDRDEKKTGKNAMELESKHERSRKQAHESGDKNEAKSEGLRFGDIAKEASGVPVIKFVSTIIEGAVNSRATDIHLDPQDPEMRVRYRIDGVLHDVMSIPPEIENAVVSRIKIMADLDITETRHAQDGHMSLDIANAEYDIRVATLPTFLGERVVLRLLDQSSVLSGIKDLGLETHDETALRHAIDQAYGMILVTGPTGSGKTTTLYAALNQKNVMTESIVTLEDPVEYQLSGINQVQIDADIDLTFANVLRATMRQDVDVILVGEIRDMETAKIAVRAAMTGHLVFSTLHTNDAPEAVATLRNMGVPSYLIASALTAVVGQRLVRKICVDCKTSYTPAKPLLKSVGMPESTRKLYRGAGCEVCYHTGCKGRTGIFEMLEVTPQLRAMIVAEAPLEQIAKAANLKTMADRCRLKVKEGIVPAEELLRVVRT